MKMLELYINKTEGAVHNFIEVDGNHRAAPAGDFRHADSDTMLSWARTVLLGSAGYEPRIRIYDAGHRVLKSGDVTRWVTLQQLEKWALPSISPESVAAVLGGGLTATA